MVPGGDPTAGLVIDALAAHPVERGSGGHGLVLHMPDGRPLDSNLMPVDEDRARTVIQAALAPSVSNLCHEASDG